MTDNPNPADSAQAGAAPGDSGSRGSASGAANGQPAERVVVRDRRKIDTTGERAGGGQSGGKGGAHAAEPDDDEVDVTAGEAADATPPAEAEPAVDRAPLGAELEALRAELDERTRDLQRVTAEYANYRKRVDRDRGVAAEQTTGAVLSTLLPVLDDLDRAREHGDLVGPFGAVADQLGAALAKYGLTAFGEKGDAFDPTRHEAVAHLTSADVTEPTCVEVMRRGYVLGERLLRPALVAVADPQ